MPHTLDQVGHLVDLLRRLNVYPATLLVVGGLPWQSHQIEQLKEWRREGWIMAGHGWVHRAERIDTAYHRVHSTLLSRDVAEHLSRPSMEAARIVRQSYQWLRKNDLGTPSLYVPPAWALGALSRRQLARLPYQAYESLAGVYTKKGKRFRMLPLVGFEADTRARAAALRPWNKANEWAARWTGTPLRISLHPNDLDLHLGRDIERILRRGWTFLDYTGL